MGRKPRVIDPRKRSGKSCRKVSRAGMSRRRVGVTGSLRICSIAGRMKPNREQRQRLGGEALPGPNRKRSPHPAVGEDARRNPGDRILKKRRGGVSCGAVHSQAREMVTQGYTATLVAATLAISRSSLYYRKRPRGSRADRPYDDRSSWRAGKNPPMAIAG